MPPPTSARQPVSSKPAPVRLGTDASQARLLTVRGAAVIAAAALPLLIFQVGSADLDVYRHGASVLVHRGSLYSSSFATGTDANLPFTYPPFAGIAALPLLPLPGMLTAQLWAVGTIAMVVWCVTVSFRQALERFPSRSDLVLALLAASFLATRPVYDHLADGQVDILLMTLCLADTLAARPGWPRGMLVGIATAIKLVPGIFIPYLWVSGRRRAAAFAAGTFLCCEGAAALVDPHDSRLYWTRLVFNTERPGRTAGYKNQSLRGILLRVLAPQGRAILLAAVALIVVLLGLALARHATRRGDVLTGAVLAGLAGVLASPVSWIHATVWVIPALGVLAGGLFSRARVWAAAAVTVALFASLPYVPNLAHGLSRPVVVLLQRSYGLICLFLLIALPILRTSRQRLAPGSAAELSLPAEPHG